MPRRFEPLRREFRPMLALAAPLVLAELGWMFMGVVDLMVVGRLPASARALGAVSIGGVLFYTVGVFGTGILLGLDTLVAQAFGAGDLRDCHRSLLDGVYLSAALTPLLMAFVWLCARQLASFGIQPEVVRLAIPYIQALVWSTFPLLLYYAFRRYLQGMNLVRPVMFALVTANLVNLAANWLLVFGNLGAPALGVEGSGWATCISRAYMAAVLIGYAFYYDRRERTGLRRIRLGPDLARMRELLRLGLPAALQVSLEVGVFALITAFIGRLDAVSLAGHQIGVMAISVTYMMPLGIASAAAVRVGQAIGRRDASGARHAGSAALLLGSACMACAGLVFLLAPRVIGRIFTHDASVIRLATTLLAWAAMFELFDGFQTVSTGALRGAGDTHTPMLCHFVAYWLLGLPAGWYLCFRRQWGAAGFWAGFCVALIPLGVTLLLLWRRKVARLDFAARAMTPAEWPR